MCCSLSAPDLTHWLHQSINYVVETKEDIKFDKIKYYIIFRKILMLKLKVFTINLDCFI